MATPEGKITPLNVSSLQASGLSVSYGSQAVVAGQRVSIEGAGPEAWFGPFQPLAPMAPQTAGRAYNYPVGANLSYIPRGDGSVSFEQLRALADNLPMLRIVIGKRMDQIAGWKWDVQPILEAKDRRKNIGAGDAQPPGIKDVRAFLRRPDRRRSFHTWLRALIEDMLVIDAACIYPRLTNGGDLYSLDIVDGATITPLLGEDGRLPLPDDGPAYQQILHGIPASDFTLDELLYLPRNVRSNRRFGFSPVEQILMTLNIALRRDVMTLAYYDTGTIPEGFGTLPASWTVDQIKQFQDWFDSLMSGNLSGRRKLRFMPDGFKFTEVRQPPLKDQYDEWLYRLICATFGVSPSGVTADVNRATAQTLQVQASNEGIGPMKAWVKEMFDDVIQRLMGFENLEFVWEGEDEIDPLEQAQAMQILVNAGIKTVDEARVEIGLGPMSPADKAALEAKNAPPAAAPGQSEPPAAKSDGEVGKRAAIPFRPLTPLALDRATLEQPRAAMLATWQAILARHARAARDAITAILSEVAKADEPAPESEADRSTWSDERIAVEVERVVEQFELDISDAVMANVRRPLEIAAQDSAERLFAQAVGILLGDDPSAGLGPGREVLGGDIFDRINTRAVAWAGEHAGALVSGVNDTTRAAVRSAVADGLAAGERYTAIIARVRALGAFSDARAEIIAETEIANANSMGALQGLFQARDSGVNVRKAWLTAGGLERICPICRANAAAGPIELEAPFPSGDMAPAAHVHCRCALIPYVQDEPTAKAARFTCE